MSTAKIAIVWNEAPSSGKIKVAYGKLAGGKVAAGNGRFEGDRFAFKGRSPGRLELSLSDASCGLGAKATRVIVETPERGFSFFVRDVTAENPVFVEIYGAAVLPYGDRRSYAEVAAAVRARGLTGIEQKITAAPEESYAAACIRNRNEKCPTWLGLGRDMRFFEVHMHDSNGFWGDVQPRHHSILPEIPESDNKPYFFKYAIGKGDACRHDITRSLDGGSLPILKSLQREDNITYELTAFATLEKSQLTSSKLRGSEWDASYPHTGGNMLTQEEKDKLKDKIAAETTGRSEEVVLRIHIEAFNSGQVPEYAWFKAPICHGKNQWLPMKTVTFDGAAGFSQFASGRVYAITQLDGKAAPEEEMAVLLQPGGKAALDIIVPHQPLQVARAKKLAARNYAADLEACRKFWRARLAEGANIQVPEAAIDERIRAGLLHCDIAAIGREPDGPVLATIGWYAPIGSESSPIIQFFDSMGLHKLAERSLEFFLVRQRDDGFIQNFGGYQLETGPALWSMGEHFRYTRDIAWVRRIRPKLLKACEYLLAWRNRNKKEELRGCGYGMADGKVADPEDFFHSFMLNGLAYVGLQRVAEMLESVDPAESRRLAREASAYRDDIRKAFYESIVRSPVIPLGDGTWIPTVPPWPDYSGPLALYADGCKWFTHGAFGSRDSLTGALYLVISEVLAPHEIGTDILIKSHQQLFTVSNAGLTQPYYVRHDFAHLVRGEVKPFLKAYYNQFTALQDRETYTFWEHYCHASQHKTHEEGWFLMQTRWMLWMENGAELRLLPGIPRAWLEDGKRIELKRAASYFGPLDLSVRSECGARRMTAQISVPGSRKPEKISIRLPHPDGLKPVKVSGGTYDSTAEAVTVSPFRGKAKVVLEF